MHHLLKAGVLAAALLGALGATAQTTATGPYYAVPSWDQKLPAAQRFVVLSNWNNEAVLDRETGVVWERDPQSARGSVGVRLSYANAISICIQARTGGRKGWRVPTISELASLYDASGESSGWMLPIGNPFLNILTGFDSAEYWSSTRYPTNPNIAFAQGFSPRGSVVTNTLDVPYGVWCVRGPGSSD